MNKNRLAASILATAAAAGGFVGTAQAAGPTTCGGKMAHKRITGDILVEAGKTCTLDHSVVRGNVVTQEGSTLTMTGSTIKGNVSYRFVNESPWNTPGVTHSLAGSRVTGTYILDPRSTYTITGSRLGELKQGFFIGTGPRGTIRSSTLDSLKYAGTMKLTGSTVKGEFSSGLGTSLAVTNTTFRGASTLTADTVQVCGSRFQRGAVVKAGMVATLGDGAQCRGSQFRSTLDVSAPRAITAHRNVVRGHTTSSETGTVTGSGNRFRGGVEGALAKLR